MNEGIKITGNLSSLFLETGEEFRKSIHFQELWGCFRGFFRKPKLSSPRKPQNIRTFPAVKNHILGFKKPEPPRLSARFYPEFLNLSTGFSTTGAEGSFFLPVNIYYNTSSSILQAK